MTMKTYLVHGFSRNEDDHVNVSMLLDHDDFDFDTSQYEKAAQIAGDRFCFHASQTTNLHIPDDCKGILFTSDDELFARVPDLNPQRRRRKGKSR